MKREILLCVGIIAVTTFLAVLINHQTRLGSGQIIFSEDMTLKKVAKKNGVPLKRILHVMSHDDHTVWKLPKEKRISALGIDSQAVKNALEHVMEESNPGYAALHYILLAILLSSVNLFVLIRKKTRKIRFIILLLSVALFGILLSGHPNPMESIVKLFKTFNNMQDQPVIVMLSFAIFSILSLVGSKLMCSWGCPLGALQESLLNIPLFKGKRRINIPFSVSLGVRLLFFLVFFLMLFGLVFGIANFVLYHHLNYFKIFKLSELAAFALYSFPALLLASLFIFRPFCQLVCPFGLYAWLLQNIAVHRIRIEREKCTECEKCITACPTEAMKGIYDQKRKYFLPDCWSCGKCIEACPAEAIYYRCK